MPLSGLEIYKHLPKTNCKECGFPTCLAFAMKLAAKGAELSACPYVSEEAKQLLDAASAPPIRLITIGKGDNRIEIGNETVLFRHEKTFYHEPGLMLRIKDTQPSEQVTMTAQQVNEYAVERVGTTLHLNGLAIENASGDASAFVSCIETVKAKTNLPLVLMSTVSQAMEVALQKVAVDRPLIYAATKDNWEDMARLAQKFQCPLVVHDEGDLSTLASLAEQVIKAGVSDIILDPETRGLKGTLIQHTFIRRLALRKNFRLVGFPIISFPGEVANSPLEEAVLAAQDIAKYAGIIVLDHFDPSLAYPLLTLRQNIYTDPQKPIQVKPDLYQIGEPAENSPLLITTNFSLTYFTVAGEVEASGIPAFLLVADAEGMSVLTAWAAGKFDAEKIAKTVKGANLESKLAHHKLVIPGYIAGISGEIEEELPNWQILVGPREAVDIPVYLKTVWQAVGAPAAAS
ncbi:MAG: acetyl-CoA decarbonylase/synthase complex subunit gamma [Chloroflexi bacterium]|nr:acetyl-CoA decarbonylase/synthase complex subunit gamma [Chloroflexota bacterium]MCL5076106.1 acetyl-CoA decarbonylase/synthase complex subunit gamma [Chloroflexota bacterium]